MNALRRLKWPIALVAAAGASLLAAGIVAATRNTSDAASLAASSAPTKLERGLAADLDAAGALNASKPQTLECQAARGDAVECAAVPDAEATARLSQGAHIYKLRVYATFTDEARHGDVPVFTAGELICNGANEGSVHCVTVATHRPSAPSSGPLATYAPLSVDYVDGVPVVSAGTPSVALGP